MEFVVDCSKLMKLFQWGIVVMSFVYNARDLIYNRKWRHIQCSNVVRMVANNNLSSTQSQKIKRKENIITKKLVPNNKRK